MDIEFEVWKNIENYDETYQVSNTGKVKNKKKETVLQPFDDGSGYMKVTLYTNGFGKDFLLHRIVAQAFIFNSENKSYVNHLDGNKKNNNVNNLQWVTSAENLKKTDVQRKMKDSKANKVLATCLSDGEVYQWGSIQDLCSDLGVSVYEVKKNIMSNQLIFKREADLWQVHECLNKRDLDTLDIFFNKDTYLIDAKGKQWKIETISTIWDKDSNVVWEKPKSNRSKQIPCNWVSEEPQYIGLTETVQAELIKNKDGDVVRVSKCEDDPLWR